MSLITGEDTKGPETAKSTWVAEAHSQTARKPATSDSGRQSENQIRVGENDNNIIRQSIP